MPGVCRRPHVLVVEDDQDILDAMLDVLQAEGFSAAGVADGRQALAYLDHEGMRPDIILLDLMMPRMDGFQFRQAQLKNPRHATIPVAVVTADGRAMHKASELQAAGFARKPVGVPALLELIDRVLAGPSPA